LLCCFVLFFRKFIDRLPDKGKKISDFAEKLMLAISQEEELARTTELLSAVRLEFQAKQDKAHISKQRVAVNEDALNQKDSLVSNENSNIKEFFKVSSQRQEAECIGRDATNTALENQGTRRKSDEIKIVTKDEDLFCEDISKSAPSSHLQNDQQLSRSNTEDGTESTGALDNSKDMLVD
ncbi:GRL1A polymerase, partial [Alectura lathami]|nr:GRL1A polymerase [Alectura lathami]